MADLPIQGPGGATGAVPGPESRPRPAAGSDASFGEALVDALDTVERQQDGAARVAAEHLAGAGPDLHSVMIELEKADLAFRTMMEVRNRLIEAYREVMRMPM